MINLTILPRTSDVQISNDRSTQIILYIDHSTGHFARFSVENFSCKSQSILRSRKIDFSSLLDCFLYRTLSDLFSKLNCENVVLNIMEQFGQGSHLHWYFFFEMTSTPHALQNVSTIEHLLPVLVLHSHSITLNFLDLYISCLGQKLIFVQFVQTPKSFLLFCFLLFCRLLLFLLDRCTENKRSSLYKFSVNSLN